MNSRYMFIALLSFLALSEVAIAQLASQPTVQATTLGAGTTTSTASLSWINGNGQRRLVIMRQGTAASLATPTDGIAYTANAVFGSGDSFGAGGFVVYDGTASGVTVSGLSANQTYSFTVYEYNRTGTTASTTNYLTTPRNTREFGTLSTVPTQASSITFTSVTTSSMTVNWTAGNGLGHLVVVTPTSTPFTPSNQREYAANPAFGSGEAFGDGFVVWSGTGTSVTVTNLSPQTTYHVRVFGYNGATPLNRTYNTATATNNPRSQLTATAEPTVQASNITITTLTPNSVTFNFTKGNGQRRVVLARQGSAPNSVPPDGNTFTANAAFGSGTQVGTGNFTVYNDTGSVVTVTNLVQNNTYFFQVFEYNGLGASSNYLTTTAMNNPRSVVTPPNQSTNITSSFITISSARIGFTIGASFGRLVVMKQGSAVDVLPTNGTEYTANTVFGSGSDLGGGNVVVQSGTGNFLDVTGLQPNTTYHVRVFEFNGNGSSRIYNTSTATGNPSNFTTAQFSTAPTTQAQLVAFSSLQPTSLTLSWANGNGAGRIVVARSGSAVDANPINGQTYSASSAFGSGAQLGSGNFVVFNGTGSSVSITGLSPNTQYHFRVYEYNGSGNTIGYQLNTATQNPNSVTTPVLLSPEPTVQANGLTFSGVTTNAMTVFWNNGNGSSRLVLARAGSAPTAQPIDGIQYTGNSNFASAGEIGAGNKIVYVGTASNFVNVTGLSASTTYHFQVFEFNGTGNTINYLTSTATGNPASQATNAPITAPTTQASNITVTGRTPNSLTFAWTNGNGNARLVLAQVGINVTGVPANNTAYSANASYGLGDAVGSSFVVYNGTGNSFTLTGLNPTTGYSIKVFEYNGNSSSPIFNTSNGVGNPSSGFTFATEPSQVQNISVTNLASGTATLSWTGGSGTGKMIIIREGSPVQDFPQPGTPPGDYGVANSNFSSAPSLGTGRIVFSSLQNSVNVTGLSPGTTYHVRAFEYNGSFDQTNYNLNPSTNNPISFSTLSALAAEPTVQGSSITFSSVTSSSMTVNWTNGNGATRLVIARDGAAVADLPQDGVSYSANSNFSSAAALGSGKVVYRGTGNSFSLTGLNASTTYHLRVFEFNGSGTSTNYLTATATGNPASQATDALIAPEPTSQATGIAFSSITPSSMTVNWTNGNGTNRIVVAREGTAIADLPQDGASYSANANFSSAAALGSGKVVYSGTGNSFSLTGLNASTTYHLRVFEFNGSGATANYITTTATGNPASQATSAGLASEPTVQASNATITDRQANSMTLKWDNGNGTARIVLMTAGGIPSNLPSDGTGYGSNANFASAPSLGDSKIVYVGSLDSVSVTNLTANTLYGFRVYEFNGSGASTNYLVGGTGNFSENLTLQTLPTTQASAITFSEITPTSLRVSWTNGNGGERLLLGRQGSAIADLPQGGTPYSSNPDFSLAPALGSGKVLYRGNLNSQVITNLTPNTTYHFRVFEVNGFGVTSNYAIGIVTGNPASQVTQAAEPTVQASSVTFSSITSSSMTVNWTNGNGATRLVIARDGAAVADLPQDGVSYSANSNFSSAAALGSGKVVYSGTGNSFSLTGLNASTTYHLRVFELNGSGATANYLTSTASGNPASQVTSASLAAEPTVQASSFSFTSVTSSSMTVNWTNGNGARRLVLARAGATISIAPQDGVGYPANADFASAQDISGHRVVYSDTGNTVEVTGLTPFTTYFFQAFEFNGSGTTANYLMGGASGNPAAINTLPALAAEPTVQASALTFTNVQAGSMTVSWTNGNGAGRLVIARAGASPDSLPVDRVAYSANVNFNNGQQLGSGRVVYTGSGNSFTLNGLTLGVTYHLRVFEYNGTGESINYLTATATGNPASRTTENNFNGSGVIAAGTYQNLTTTGNTTLQGNVTVNGIVSLSGVLNTSTFSLTLGQAATMTETASNYVLGTVIASRILNNSSNTFGGMGVIINASINGGSSLGTVTVERRSGSGAIVSINGSPSISRRWKITPQSQPANPVQVFLSWLGQDDNNRSLTQGVLWKSTDNGVSWTQVASGNYSGRAVSYNTTSFSDWTITDNSSVLSAREEANMPREFGLMQNYPNPFNPSTRIRYALASAGEVTLEVYDLLGHKVATVVSGRQNAGLYDINFNAASLSTGHYYYRLSVNGNGTSFTKTMKMTLVK